MPTGNPYTMGQAQAPSLAMQLIAPDIAQEQTQLARRQQMADLLRSQALQPTGNTEIVNGWAVKKSPLEGLAKIAQGLASHYTQDQVDTRQLDLAKALQGRMGSILGNGTPDPAAQPPAPVPAMQSAPVDPTAPSGPMPGAPDPSAPPMPQMPAPQPPSQPVMPQQPAAPAMPTQAAPVPTQPGTPPVSKNNFTLGNLLKSNVIGDLGGQSAGSAYWESLKPTDATKRDGELGIDAPQARAYEMAKRLKEGTQALVAGQTNILPNGTKVVAPNFETGVAGGFDANGNPTATAIPGSAGIAADRAGGIKQAEAAVADKFALPAPVDAAGGKVALTPTQQRSAANGGVDPAASGGITNPGNMRPPGAGTGFANYATPQEGLAALDKNLQSYGKQGVNTVSSIISKWAPPSENNTAAYVADVSARLGIKPDQPLDMSSPIVRQALSTAITLHEHGPAKVFAPVGIPLRSDVQKAQDDAAVKLATQPAIDMKTKEAVDMADYSKTLNGHLSDSQALLQRIEQSRQALTKFTAGGGGETRSQLASLAQSIPGVSTSLVDKIAGGDLSASQEFQKYAAQEALGTMQQALASDTGKGSQGNRVAMQLFIKNNPNIDTDPRAIEKIFNFQTQQHNNLLDQSNAYQQYKDTPGNDPSKFPNYWAGEAIRRGFVKPEIRSGYAKGVPANVQSLLDKYK